GEPYDESREARGSSAVDGQRHDRRHEQKCAECLRADRLAVGDPRAEHGSPGVVQVRRALAEDRDDQHASAEGADELGGDVRNGLDPGEAAHDGQRERDRRVDMRAGRTAERVDHYRDHERERERDDAQPGVVELAVPEPQRRDDGAGSKNDEERRADGLGQEPAAEIGCHKATTLLNAFEISPKLLRLTYWGKRGASRRFCRYLRYIWRRPRLMRR